MKLASDRFWFHTYKLLNIIESVCEIVLNISNIYLSRTFSFIALL